jgi:hypothetical protein
MRRFRNRWKISNKTVEIQNTFVASALKEEEEEEEEEKEERITGNLLNMSSYKSSLISIYSYMILAANT